MKNYLIIHHRLLPTVFLLCIAIISHAQLKSITYGDISKQDLEMESYDKDPSAKAVVLYDKGKSVFFDKGGGFDIRFTRHKRIKIFDKSETSPSEITIPYYKDGLGKTEKITKIKATTYYQDDGSLVKKQLDPKTVYEEQISENWYQKKFVFPDVQNGAVIEYEYTFETPFKFHLPDWKYQDRIPTIYSEYELRFIPFYEYVYQVQGVTTFDYEIIKKDDKLRTLGDFVPEQEKSRESHFSNVLNNSLDHDPITGVAFTDEIHKYVLKDVPAFKDEDYISSIDDYIIKHNFQLAQINQIDGKSESIISTWVELNKELLEHENFGKYLNSASKIINKTLLSEFDFTNKSSVEKAKVIIAYVKDNFAWNNIESKYASQSAKKFYVNKSGNSADINLFLVALLNEAGINSSPLIISTRDNGKINVDYPFDRNTNYVLASIPLETPIIGDATNEMLPYHKLPLTCYNDIGLIVNDNTEEEWIEFKNVKVSEERHFITMSFDPSTAYLKNSVLIQQTDHESFGSRVLFEDDPKKIMKYYNEEVGKVEAVKTACYDMLMKPYSIQLNTTYEPEKLNEDIIISPFLDLPLDENFLTQKERSYPVDFVYPWKTSFETKFEIPDGYEVKDLPENFHLEDTLVDVSLDYQIVANKVIAKGSYEMKKDLYITSEYSNLKSHIDDIIKHFNQSFLLEKL